MNTNIEDNESGTKYIKKCDSCKKFMSAKVDMPICYSCWSKEVEEDYRNQIESRA